MRCKCLIWQNFNLWISFCESVSNRHFHLPNALDQSQGQGQFSCQQGTYYCWYLLCSLWDVCYCFFTYHLKLWSFKNNNVTEKKLVCTLSLQSTWTFPSSRTLRICSTLPCKAARWSCWSDGVSFWNTNNTNHYQWYFHLTTIIQVNMDQPHPRSVTHALLLNLFQRSWSQTD